MILEQYKTKSLMLLSMLLAMMLLTKVLAMSLIKIRRLPKEFLVV